MKTVWLVNVDRYGDESKAKGGAWYTLEETAQELITKYIDAISRRGYTPEIKIVGIAMGHALHSYLESKGIPCKLLNVGITRIGNADVLIYPESEDGP